MTIQEHIKYLLAEGDQWNKWRDANPKIKPNLRGANLAFANLDRADLTDANLVGANLLKANLTFANLDRADLTDANLEDAKLTSANLEDATLARANLTGAELAGAQFNRANLTEAKCGGAIFFGVGFIKANLSRAYLYHTDFKGANLNEASLSGANLCEATLNETDLLNTDLSNVDVGDTTFGNLDLRFVKGLDTIKHYSPSTIGTDTLLRSRGEIPEIFLRGVGLSDSLIEYTRSLCQTPIDYYTCFISYSSRDEEFAERLYADLQARGVRCWFAPEDLKAGEWFADRIEQSIRVYDRLILVLSEHSIESSWVEHEVRAAMEKEDRFRRENHIRKAVLFPVKLDRAIENAPAQWAGTIRRERHMLNFTQWQEHQAYMRSFERLMRDLKREDTPIEE